MGEPDSDVAADAAPDAGAGAAAAAAARNLRFQQLALPHLDAAYNLARWLCGNANDADDVVQEAFMRAFRFFDTFRGDTARPWLLAIVRRTWYTEWRRRASSHEVVEFDETLDETTFDGWSSGVADPQTLLIRDEDARLVHAALEQLPVEFREVLILRELEEMGYREIAIVADLPIGTVMSRLARGRRKLAGLLAVLQARGLPVGAAGADSALCDAPGAAKADSALCDAPGAGNADSALRDAPGAAKADSALRVAPGAGNADSALRDAAGAANADPALRDAAGASATAFTDAVADVRDKTAPLPAGQSPLSRGIADARPLNTVGGTASGFAQEAPDGL